MIEVGENQNLNHYSGKNRAANHATIAKKTNVSAAGEQLWLYKSFFRPIKKK
jgi:hypothetical protein